MPYTPELVYRGFGLKSQYQNVPYHNFPHALGVLKKFGELIDGAWGRSGVRRYAILGHDARHGWLTLPEDELTASQACMGLIADLGPRVCQRVDELIHATVFVNRSLYARRGDPDERAIADADISNVGDTDFEVFLRESARLCLETAGQGVILDEQAILDFFGGTMKGFIPFLLRASSDDQPFISDRGKALWADNFHRNRDKLDGLLSTDEGRQKVVDMVYEEARRFYGRHITA